MPRTTFLKPAEIGSIMLQPLSFAHLANLHTLDLSHNKIHIIEPSAIIGSDYLMVRLQGLFHQQS